MNKRNRTNFKVESYVVDAPGSIVITGQKLPPPSKRITLHQKNMKVLNAKIIYKSKKGEIEFEVGRINHVKSFGEIRLHTNNLLYPGIYELTIKFRGELDENGLKN